MLQKDRYFDDPIHNRCKQTPSKKGIKQIQMINATGKGNNGDRGRSKSIAVRLCS